MTTAVPVRAQDGSVARVSMRLLQLCRQMNDIVQDCDDFAMFEQCPIECMIAKTADDFAVLEQLASGESAAVGWAQMPFDRLLHIWNLCDFLIFAAIQPVSKAIKDRISNKTPSELRALFGIGENEHGFSEKELVQIEVEQRWFG